MLGIVVLNFINWDASLQCINSIRETVGKIQYIIYLVDNASPRAPSSEQLKFIEDGDDIIFIKNCKNLGYSAGNNVGIRMAIASGCDYILIANSDVMFIKNCINAMISYLSKHSRVGIIGPKAIRLDGSVHTPGMLIKTGMKEKYIFRTFLRVLFKSVSNKYYNYDDLLVEPIRVHSVSGACFMMTKSCAIDIFPFDENTFLFEEELILGIAMEEKSYITIYNPLCTVIHAHGQSTKYITAFSFICFVESEIYYCKKYLKSDFLHIFPLYLIRAFSYFIRMFRHKDFRINCYRFLRRTSTKLFFSGLCIILFSAGAV